MRIPTPETRASPVHRIRALRTGAGAGSSQDAPTSTAPKPSAMSQVRSRPSRVGNVCVP